MTVKRVSTEFIQNLFSISKDEISKLVKVDVLPKPIHDQFDLIASIQQYIQFLNNNASKIVDQNDAAAHLSMTDRNFRSVIKGLGITWPADIDYIREQYIQDLREKAAGRGGDAQGILVAARIRDLNAGAEVKELTVKEKAGELVSVADIEPQLLSMVTAARQELLTLPEKLASDVKALHDVDIDVSLVQDRIYESLKHLATRLHDDDAGDDVAGDEVVATTS